jgi:hypothetical protein
MEKLKTDKPVLDKKGIKPSTMERVAGDASSLRKLYKPFLPSEMVAGSIPHIAGAEEESVWNAAAQACGTERIHYTYTIEDGKCWYVATPSSSLASHPDAWCPLIAALPGNSEHWDKETVYLYEQDGQAGARRWVSETGRMQLFLGASRSILPKVQTMDANFVTINAQTADVYLWQNKELKADMLTRAVAKLLVIAGIAVGLLASLYILIMFAMVNLITPQLDDAKAETELATLTLLKDASESLENDAIKHVFRIQELLDNLSQIDGTLVKYEVKDGNQVVWEALVPRAFSTGGNAVLRGAQPVGNKLEADGRVRIRGTR